MIERGYVVARHDYGDILYLTWWINAGPRWSCDFADAALFESKAAADAAAATFEDAITHEVRNA